MKSLARILAITVAFLAPAFAFAGTIVGVGSGGIFVATGINGGAPGTIYGIAAIIINIINAVLVPLIFALSFIVFLYGIAQAYIFSRGDEEAVKKGHKLALWGIIGFVIMISLWGLVNVVSNTFDLWGYTPQSLPQSYAPTP